MSPSSSDRRPSGPRARPPRVGRRAPGLRRLVDGGGGFVLLLATASAAGCSRHPRAAPGRSLPVYSYAVAPPAEGSWLLRVDATFEGAPGARLVSEAAGAVREVRLADGSPAARSGDAWVVGACDVRCTVRYTVDLDALASACPAPDCGRRVGDAFLGTASAWLLRPESPDDATVRVHLAGGDPSRFATGLRRDGAGGFVLRARELAESSYTAFGAFRRARARAPGANLDVVLLGDVLPMGDAAAVGWVSSAAACVAGLFGHFPVDATVFVVPVPGAEGVVFGRVMSLAGASVLLLFGERTRAAAVHDDWVVVHELFHLGCPSFEGEGRWLEEGLATYYEPVLRERSGWTTEAALWSHFVREMPRGLRRPDQPRPIERRDDIDSTYWGGALFALLADVSVRRATRGLRSLDDVVRGALAREGDATHGARVADFVRVGDEATGTGALAGVFDRWAVGGEDVDLDAVWRDLGVVVRGGEVTLNDDAPLAWVRRGIAPRGDEADRIRGRGAEGDRVQGTPEGAPSGIARRIPGGAH